MGSDLNHGLSCESKKHRPIPERERNRVDLDLSSFATLHGPRGTEMDRASVIHRPDLLFRLLVESGDVHQ